MVNAQQIAAADVPDWAPILRGLYTRFRTGDFNKGIRLVDAFAEAADVADHHPEVVLTYGHVDVRLTSHDAGDVTERDLALARTFSEIAATQNVPAAPGERCLVELGLDTADATRIAPFWSAVLGQPVSDGEVTDPTGIGPTIWFQPTEPHEPPRQRFHLDVWVDPRVVRERIDAALAAGGTLVSDAEAPRFWILADTQGNKACLCTAEDR
ncbi:4a-hydroxytetrahydrobiopterin dehydratase [Tsukamurella sp. 8F]|uniref:VOC family protein n=1 Tax=unclassified Tsukamurella TaxID=2633480 RepID=UPI0023B955B3|nr:MULTISPECIES: VOC family protein [unclassified Tsukamurella]MDF0531769.1 4a-hydroxytetrahydrobiopterin dehydratase [Tsukamurella sp. 8J]MDF0588029.1 4a-hydroxytetrahydrobiopterin dehydratase [Tsukamurella sp. 8F]